METAQQWRLGPITSDHRKGSRQQCTLFHLLVYSWDSSSSPPLHKELIWSRENAGILHDSIVSAITERSWTTWDTSGRVPTVPITPLTQLELQSTPETRSATLTNADPLCGLVRRVWDMYLGFTSTAPDHSTCSNILPSHYIIIALSSF